MYSPLSVGSKERKTAVPRNTVGIFLPTISPLGLNIIRPLPAKIVNVPLFASVKRLIVESPSPRDDFATDVTPFSVASSMSRSSPYPILGNCTKRLRDTDARVQNRQSYSL